MAECSDETAEKLSGNEHLRAEDVSIEISLLDLALKIVPRVRMALGALRSHDLLHQFFKYDADNSGKLSSNEMKEVARDMGLDIRTLTKEVLGDEIDFEGFQSIIVKGRELLERTCHAREREIQDKAGLSDADFSTFSSDLVGLFDLYSRLDPEDTGALPASDLWFLFQEAGFAPKNHAEKE